MAALVPAAVREATSGGTDGILEITRRFFREVLEEAADIHLLRREVLRLTRRLSTREREIFGRLSDGDWDELVKVARTMADAFRSTKASRRQGAIASLKGKLAEIVFFNSDTFRRVVREAEDLVDAINLKSGAKLDKATVELKTAVRSEGAGVAGDLTEGVVVAVRDDGDYQILAIIEMRSRSNRNDLARRRSREFELDEEIEDNSIFRREGQLEADIERLSELDLSFDAEFVPAGTAHFSRHDTMWIGVTPSDVQLSQMQLDRITPLISNFRQLRQEISDRSLTRLSTKLLELLSEIAD